MQIICLHTFLLLLLCWSLYLKYLNLIDWALLLIAAFNILGMCSNRAPCCIGLAERFFILKKIVIIIEFI